MGSVMQRPKETALKALMTEVSKLRERVEDLEDLRDLLAAEKTAGNRPGIPWSQAKKLLELEDDTPARTVPKTAKRTKQ